MVVPILSILLSWNAWPAGLIRSVVWTSVVSPYLLACGKRTAMSCAINLNQWADVMWLEVRD
eukprot:scaffold422640_cov20-Prasinocladus_malaysianus.AAC.2